MADEQDSILKVIVELVDKVTEPLRKVNESFEEFQESVHGIFTSGAEVFAGYEAIKGLVEPAAAFAEAQAHLALATGFTNEKLAEMKEQAASLSTQFPKNLEDITAAQEELYKTFGETTNLEEATKMATKLATVLGIDAVTGANVLSAAYEQLGDKTKPIADQMGTLADKLSLLKDRYMKPGEASSLERDIQRIGKSAQAAGISQNQMFAIWAEGNRLHAGGPRGFGMVEASLFDTLAKSSKELEKAGLQVVHNSQGGVNMIATLERINQMSQQGKMKLFAELPGQAKVLVEMAAHMKDIRDTMETFRGASGELEKGSQALANTPEAKMERLKQTVENLADTIGQQTLPQIIHIVEVMDKWVTAIDKFLTVHPAVAKAVGDLALGIAALLTAGGIYGFVKIIGNVIKLGGELLALPAILGLVQGAWFVLVTGVTEGFAAMGTAALIAFESNPIGWIITALAVVALISYEIWKHWDDIVNTIKDAVEGVKEFAHNASPKDWFEGVVGMATNNPALMAEAYTNATSHVNYAPTVHVSVAPGTDPHAVGADVVNALTSHATSLDDLLNQSRRDNARRSFGDPTLAVASGSW